MPLARSAAAGMLALSLAACTNAATRLSELGEVPQMSKITDPTKAPGYTPVSMPVPAAQAAVRQTGSIWQPGARAFFKDQRASRVGDVLTVQITVNDNAKLDNVTKGNRADSDKVSLTNLFGLETQTKGFLPKAFDPTNAVNTSNAHVSDGEAQVNRSEQISLTLAALVTQVLPNGNLVIVGRQEFRVNYDVRELQLAGIVRPTDIDATNTITSDKIADARVSYGGHGQGSDLQQPRYGQQLLDIVSPF